MPVGGCRMYVTFSGLLNLFSTYFFLNSNRPTESGDQVLSLPGSKICSHGDGCCSYG